MSGEGSELEEFSDDSDISPEGETDSQSQVVQVSASWSGPIPPPADLERYEGILPGAANRILMMAENAQANRYERDRRELDIEERVVVEDSRRSYLGVAAALLISVLCIGGGIYLISNGHGWEGTILVGIDLAALAGAFIYGTKSRDRRRWRDAGEVEEE